VYNIEHGDTLILKGFNEESGEENHFVSYEIYTPYEKIQYMFSILYQYLTDKHSHIVIELTDSERAIYGDNHYVSLSNGYICGGKKYIENDKFSVTTKCFEKYNEYKWFKKAVLDYFDSDAFRIGFDNTTEIKKLEIARDIFVPTLYSDFGNSLEIEHIFDSKKVFQKFFDNVMDTRKTILLMDVPYSPYDKPEMHKC
jgi:hypothetical protein